MRPLGIPVLEDKIVQQAVRMILEPIWENDFADESIGYRPGRSPRAATQELGEALHDGKHRWVVEAAICDEHQIHPTLFYQWQKTFFENGAAAFDRSPRSRGTELGSQRIEQLEARLKRKDEVIAAVTEELVRTKKELGED